MKTIVSPKKFWTIESFDNLQEYLDLIKNKELIIPGIHSPTASPNSYDSYDISRYLSAAIGQRMSGATGVDQVYVDIPAERIEKHANQYKFNSHSAMLAKEVLDKLNSTIYPQYGQEARLLVTAQLHSKFYGPNYFDEIASIILHPSSTQSAIWIDPTTLDTHDTFWFAKTDKTVSDILETNDGIRVVTPIKLTIAKILQGRNAGSILIQNSRNSPLEIFGFFDSSASLGALIHNICASYSEFGNLKTVLNDLKPFLLSLL